MIVVAEEKYPKRKHETKNRINQINKIANLFVNFCLTLLNLHCAHGSHTVRRKYWKKWFLNEFVQHTHIHTLT